jgi:hypothetical protein
LLLDAERDGLTVEHKDKSSIGSFRIVPLELRQDEKMAQNVKCAI